jgi:MtN3 and saliva related transmembrane protein
MELIDVLGMIAGSISAVTFLPQVIKTWKTKSAGDISLLMFTFATVSVILWLVYGIVKKSIPIIYTNSLVLVCSLIMLYFKCRYSKNDKEVKTTKESLKHED